MRNTPTTIEPATCPKCGDTASTFRRSPSGLVCLACHGREVGVELAATA